MEERSQTPREQWNVPDWRNEGDYPEPLPENYDEEIDHWRWEFLRRDKEYRQDWEDFLKFDHPFKLALRDDPEEHIPICPNIQRSTLTATDTSSMFYPNINSPGF